MTASQESLVQKFLRSDVDFTNIQRPEPGVATFDIDGLTFAVVVYLVVDEEGPGLTEEELNAAWDAAPHAPTREELEDIFREEEADDSSYASSLDAGAGEPDAGDDGVGDEA